MITRMATVETATNRFRETAPKPPQPPREPRRQGEHGTSTGVNTAPGSNDDGWIVPRPVRLSDGTYVQLYKDGEALHAAYDAIKRAQKRVCLEVYIFADDDTGNAFADLLCAKAQQGLKVFVIYDSVGSCGIEQLSCPKPRLFEKMRRAGVRVAEFHPLRMWEGNYSWKPVQRDHRKLLLVDDDIAGMGGINVGREYAGSWVVSSGQVSETDLWRDNAVGIVGPASRWLFECFARTWKYIHSGGRTRRAELIHPIDGDDFGVLASVPSMNSPLVSLLRERLNSAKSSIEMTMAYFAPPDELVDVLCKRARGGVKVRLMLPGRGDVPILLTAARSFYERLLPCGVEIYERQHVILHAKTMCIDREYSILGSSNLDYRSIEYNLELSCMIRSKEFGLQMHDLFENDVRYARRITSKEWRRRPWSDRFVQWAVKRARYLL
jgi:cardiolipin synthase A/B